MIHNELYLSLTFFIDVLFISPSLNVTVLAFTPIYMATHYFHARLVIEAGDIPSVIMKCGVVAVQFFMIFFIYYFWNI